MMKIGILHSDELNDDEKLISEINTCEMHILAFNKAIKKTKKRLFNIYFVILLILFVSIFYLESIVTSGNGLSYQFVINVLAYSISLIVLGLTIKNILHIIKELEKNRKPFEIRLKQLRAIQAKNN